MTYLPPPQPPQQPPPQGPLGYSPYPHRPSFGPAGRAAVVLWILGGIGSLCGVCFASATWIIPMDQIVTQLKQSLPQEQLKQLGNIDLAQAARVFYTVAGILFLLTSIALITLGMFVRRGSRGATITALVVGIIIVGWCVLCVLVGIVQSITISPVLLGGVLIWLVVGSGMGLALYWLVQALRATAAVRQQLQAQYLRFQQQPAAQQQAGYGYGYSPPPSPTTDPQQTLGPIPPPTREQNSGPGGTSQG